MVVFLLLTFIVLKVKTPILPDLSTNQERIPKRMAIAGVAFGSFGIILLLTFVQFRSIEKFLVFQTQNIIVNGILVPSYFIYTLPNLRQYFKKCFNTNITKPMSNALYHLRCFLSSSQVHSVSE